MPLGTAIPERSIQRKHLAFDLKGKASVSVNKYPGSPATLLHTATAGEDITAGAIWVNDSGVAYQADSDQTADRPAIAIATYDTLNGEELEYVYTGEITIAGATFTINKDIFVSGTSISTTPPTTSATTIIQRVGRAITTERMSISIEQAYYSDL